MIEKMKIGDVWASDCGSELQILHVHDNGLTADVRFLKNSPRIPYLVGSVITSFRVVDGSVRFYLTKRLVPAREPWNNVERRDYSEYAKRVLGEVRYGNSLCSAHPLQLVEEYVRELERDKERALQSLEHANEDTELHRQRLSRQAETIQNLEAQNLALRQDAERGIRRLSEIQMEKEWLQERNDNQYALITEMEKELKALRAQLPREVTITLKVDASAAVKDLEPVLEALREMKP